MTHLFQATGLVHGYQQNHLLSVLLLFRNTFSHTEQPIHLETIDYMAPPLLVASLNMPNLVVFEEADAFACLVKNFRGSIAFQ